MPKMHINKSININASADKIFKVLNDFNQWTSWSPWLIMDPSAKVTVASDSKSYEWEGKRVGSGNMKILSEDGTKSIDYDLNFLKPWKSNAKVRFELKSEGDETKVSWLMDSSLPFFMFWMKKMMEGFVGMDYDRGLRMLKELVEDGKIHSKLEFRGNSSFSGFKYIGIKTSTSINNVGPQMEADFGKLGAFMKEHADIADQSAFSQYHKWDVVKDKVVYTSGVAVKSIPSDLPDGFVSGEIPSSNVHTVRHVGKYDHLGNAWSTLYAMQRGKELKLKKGVHPFEVYLNSPEEVDEKELITDINFAVK
ncbi:MAG: SRPBCC family protein [Cyclobacteriaceae bacterium]|nr:SRPBCC family protein [Cyclobacteriaceae bacterium HetDA_MAG_MS6]